jgi:uncharacterized protein YwqG
MEIIGSPVLSDADRAALIFRDLSRPALHLLTGDQPARSHLGGSPELPPGFEWPPRGNRPLAFLGRLDLAEVANSYRFDWLPPSGDLLFFYDAEEQPWGAHPDDADGWRVIYLPSTEINLVRTLYPLDRGGRLRRIYHTMTGLRPAVTLAFPRVFLHFRQIATAPNWEDHAYPLSLDDPVTTVYNDTLRAAAYGTSPQHQLGGVPNPIQNPNLAEECLLVSHGVDLTHFSGWRDPRVKFLRDQASEWRLLLQLDTDSAPRFSWGEAGMLYFYVREHAARTGDFSGVWAILQSC